MLEGDGEVAGGVGGEVGIGLTCVLVSGHTSPIDVCCYFLHYYLVTYFDEAIEDGHDVSVFTSDSSVTEYIYNTIISNQY